MSVATRSQPFARHPCGDSQSWENPIDQAEACAKARRELGRRRPDLGPAVIDQFAARDLGLNLDEFWRVLALRALGAEVRDLVADGELSVGQALALSAVPESRRQRALAREAVERALTPEVVSRAAELLAQRPALRVRAAVDRACRRRPPERAAS